MLEHPMKWLDIILLLATAGGGKTAAVVHSTSSRSQRRFVANIMKCIGAHASLVCQTRLDFTPFILQPAGWELSRSSCRMRLEFTPFHPPTCTSADAHQRKFDLL